MVPAPCRGGSWPTGRASCKGQCHLSPLSPCCPLPSTPGPPGHTCAPHLRGCGQGCLCGTIHRHQAGVERRHVAGFAGLHSFQAKPAGETCPERGG